MKIRHPLPQFENETVLLIVSGHSSADFYVCRNGHIENRDAFRIAKPVYLDREGFFMKSGYGKVFGTGSVLKNLKNYVQNRFVSNLVKKADRLAAREKVAGIFLFSPDYMTGMILEKMPRRLAGQIRMCVYGNFTKSHPLELVDKIREVYDASIGARPSERKEVCKILKKADEAQKSSP